MYNSFAVFLFLAIAGAVEVVWLMAIIAHHRAAEPPLLRHLRRGSLALIGLSFLWGAWFALKEQWEPWPPCLPVMAGVVLYLGLTIIATYTRYGAAPEAVQAAKWPGGYEGSLPLQQASLRGSYGVRLNGSSSPSAIARPSESSATVF